MRQLLMRITARLPVREIRGDNGEQYLERYHVAAIGPIRVSIHRFLASDPDRGLHSHPWHAVSIVLVGEYRELLERGGVLYWARRRWVNTIAPGRFHRVMKPANVPEVWTLFVHGPRVAGWGFLKGGVYRPVTSSASENPWAAWWKSAPRGRDLRQAQPRRAA